jgi:hypothetical protein
MSISTVSLKYQCLAGKNSETPCATALGGACIKLHNVSHQLLEPSAVIGSAIVGRQVPVPGGDPIGRQIAHVQNVFMHCHI